MCDCIDSTDTFIKDLAISKMVASGQTLTFKTKQEAELIANKMQSYSYPISITDKNGKDIGIIWGVPK
jgi:hypothetical protein